MWNLKDSNSRVGLFLKVLYLFKSAIVFQKTPSESEELQIKSKL